MSYGRTDAHSKIVDFFHDETIEYYENLFITWNIMKNDDCCKYVAKQKDTMGILADCLAFSKVISAKFILSMLIRIHKLSKDVVYPDTSILENLESFFEDDYDEDNDFSVLQPHVLFLASYLYLLKQFTKNLAQDSFLITKMVEAIRDEPTPNRLTFSIFTTLKTLPFFKKLDLSADLKKQYGKLKKEQLSWSPHPSLDEKNLVIDDSDEEAIEAHLKELRKDTGDPQAIDFQLGAPGPDPTPNDQGQPSSQSDPNQLPPAFDPNASQYANPQMPSGQSPSLPYGQPYPPPNGSYPPNQYGQPPTPRASTPQPNPQFNTLPPNQIGTPNAQFGQPYQPPPQGQYQQSPGGQYQPPPQGSPYQTPPQEGFQPLSQNGQYQPPPQGQQYPPAPQGGQYQQPPQGGQYPPAPQGAYSPSQNGQPYPQQPAGSPPFDGQYNNYNQIPPAEPENTPRPPTPHTNPSRRGSVHTIKSHHSNRPPKSPSPPPPPAKSGKKDKKAKKTPSTEPPPAVIHSSADTGHVDQEAHRSEVNELQKKIRKLERDNIALQAENQHLRERNGDNSSDSDSTGQKKGKQKRDVALERELKDLRKLLAEEEEEKNEVLILLNKACTTLHETAVKDVTLEQLEKYEERHGIKHHVETEDSSDDSPLRGRLSRSRRRDFDGRSPPRRRLSQIRRKPRRAVQIEEVQVPLTEEDSQFASFSKRMLRPSKISGKKAKFFPSNDYAILTSDQLHNLSTKERSLLKQIVGDNYKEVIEGKEREVMENAATLSTPRSSAYLAAVPLVLSAVSSTRVVRARLVGLTAALAEEIETTRREEDLMRSAERFSPNARHGMSQREVQLIAQVEELTLSIDDREREVKRLQGQRDRMEEKYKQISDETRHDIERKEKECEMLRMSKDKSDIEIEGLKEKLQQQAKQIEKIRQLLEQKTAELKKVRQESNLLQQSRKPRRARRSDDSMYDSQSPSSESASYSDDPESSESMFDPRMSAAAQRADRNGKAELRDSYRRDRRKGPPSRHSSHRRDDDLSDSSPERYYSQHGRRRNQRRGGSDSDSSPQRQDSSNESPPRQMKTKPLSRSGRRSRNDGDYSRGHNSHLPDEPYPL